LNLQGLTSGTYTFTFTLADYGTRYYVTDLNQYSKLDINFLMLPTTLGTNIEFKFFAPNKTTILTNTWVLIKNTNKNNFVISRIKTNSLGIATIFLDTNTGYNTFNLTNTPTGINYDYNSISVIIKKPKDEDTSVDIAAAWSLVMSGITTQTFANLTSATKTLALYTNTVNNYIFTIDSNAYVGTTKTYSPRSYYANFPGADTTFPLQPYLLANASSIIIYTQNTLLTPISGVNIDIYRVTISGYTLVEQIETDISGSSQVALKANQDYYFDVTYNEITYFSKQRKEIVTGTVYFILNVEADTEYVVPGKLNVSFLPGYSFLSTVSYDRLIKINPICYSVTITSFDINALQYDINNNLISNLYSYHTGTDVCGVQQSFNIDTDFTGLIDSNYPLRITVNVTADGIDYYYEKYYNVLDSNTQQFNLIYILQNNVWGDLGCKRTGNILVDSLVPCPTALLIIAGIMIFTAVGLTRKINLDKVGIIMLIELGLFTFFGWFPLGAFGIIAVMGIIVIGVSNFNW